MQRKTVATVLVVAMLAIAGCSSGIAPGGSGDDGGEGTVNMYISDQPNAIEDFEHLNVTVTEIAVHRADANDSEENESEGNESGWVTRDIDNVTVDLTELQGANASELGEIPVPNGSYDKTFIHVESNITGELTDGSTTDVKLPSEKLHVNKNFTVGDGEEVDFVFDIAVHKAGGSGKYVIRPVVGESGTDKEIREKPSAKRGGQGQQGADSDDDETATTVQTESTETPTSTQTDASLEFYVSDEENAIGDFDHLNVTIERVGVHRADPDENESAWVEKSVDNRTVDLTELQGANATSLGTMFVPNGTYDKTFVYVSEVNGTLTNGEHPHVKLPSSKLQLNSEFTVGNGEEVDYVFDITVVKRGNSGSYNLKPVASESGTSDQVEIEKKGNENETEENESAEDEQVEPLTLELDGNATAGENVTVTVTQNGSAVAGAAVSANGENVGETGENGTIVVAVPADAEELELEAEHEEAEGELTVAVEDGESTATPARIAGPA